MPAPSRARSEKMGADVPAYLNERRKGGEVATTPSPSSVTDVATPTDAAALGDAGVADAAVPVPGGAAAPAALDAKYGTCGTATESTARDAFAAKRMYLFRNIPSTGMGMFDASYRPASGMLSILFKVKFDFVPADGAPGPLMRAFIEAYTGTSLASMYWTPAEEAAFEWDYLTRVSAQWSQQHDIVSTKPCWGFHAMPLVLPMSVEDPVPAHYVYTVHKQPSGMVYRSSTGFPTAADGGSGDLWSSDVRENPDFQSKAVAASERRRLEAALTASGAAPVLFERDSDELGLMARLRLLLWATALVSKQPHDPLIPIRLDGFASAEGESKHNMDLSRRRAEAVRDALVSMGVPQPVVLTGRGPVGAPNDAANRRVDIAVDHALETTYAANHYTVVDHEFGHAMGLPDEYQNFSPTSGAHPKVIALQTQAQNLFKAAGVRGPATWGNYTSSVMAGGVDVLPRHYVTFWEALSRMTSPSIAQGEWQIV